MIDSKKLCYHDWQKDLWGQRADQMKKEYHRTTGYFVVHSIWSSRTETDQTSERFWLWYSQGEHDRQDKRGTIQEKENQGARGVRGLLKLINN